MLYAEAVGPPRFLENPHAGIPPSKDPGGPVAPCLSGVPILPSAKPTTSAPAMNLCFRGSITRTACSLCTLRRPGHPDTTQHSVPAGGRPWPDGIGCPQGSREKFQSSLPYPLLPGFAWRTGFQRRCVHTSALPRGVKRTRRTRLAAATRRREALWRSGERFGVAGRNSFPTYREMTVCLKGEIWGVGGVVRRFRQVSFDFSTAISVVACPEWFNAEMLKKSFFSYFHSISTVDLTCITGISILEMQSRSLCACCTLKTIR